MKLVVADTGWNYLNWLISSCEGTDNPCLSPAWAHAYWDKGWDAIVLREKISINYANDMWYANYAGKPAISGPTMQLAAMRCFVINRKGAEVEIPESMVLNPGVRDLKKHPYTGPEQAALRIKALNEISMHTNALEYARKSLRDAGIVENGSVSKIHSPTLMQQCEAKISTAISSLKAVAGAVGWWKVCQHAYFVLRAKLSTFGFLDVVNFIKHRVGMHTSDDVANSLMKCSEKELLAQLMQLYDENHVNTFDEMIEHGLFDEVLTLNHYSTTEFRKDLAVWHTKFIDYAFRGLR